jgi:RP/EB family microtubule-associated protein
MLKQTCVEQPIPVERLVKCKMQDNLEFLQWIKKYWDQNYPGTEYDPEGRRQGQGVAPPPLHGASTARAGPGAAALSSGGATRSPARKTTAAASAAPVRRPAAAAAAPPAAIGGAMRTAARPVGVRQQVVPDETIQALTAQMDEMKVSVDSLERERDFYFNKVGNLVQQSQELLDAAG